MILVGVRFRGCVVVVLVLVLLLVCCWEHVHCFGFLCISLFAAI